MHRAQMNFIAIHQLYAILGNLLLVDPDAAGGTFIIDAVMSAIQVQGGVKAGDGDVVFKGDVGLRRGAPQADLARF
ncbi:MAG: hypothetical protein M5U34_41795 [Chloroflexi bacterium]|nr:hypothetical protein [Chloroflexota bacterium]